MAKRDIPEINAGSMADIAFLLLIFFLVTTTMEKDTAYIRQIPKKIEINVPPPDIEDRNICEIRANSRNELLFRNEPLEDPDKISDKIIEFYEMNEGLSDEQTGIKIADPSYKGFDYPFYSFVTEREVLDAIDHENDLLDAADEAENYDFVEFHDKAIRDWRKKITAMKTLGITELKEIHQQAHIRVAVMQKTEYRLFAKIQSEIEEALYELRNKAAEKYFGESYGIIKNRRAQDKADEKGDQKKLDALEVLYPARIIEVRPKN